MLTEALEIVSVTKLWRITYTGECYRHSHRFFTTPALDRKDAVLIFRKRRPLAEIIQVDPA